jgi:hypothetical protein
VQISLIRSSAISSPPIVLKQPIVPPKQVIISARQPIKPPKIKPRKAPGAPIDPLINAQIGPQQYGAMHQY